MSDELERLRRHRQALLLAEVAGWLHDVGKCSDEHVRQQAADPEPEENEIGYKGRFLHLLPAEKIVSLAGEAVTLVELVKRGMPRAAGNRSLPWLVRALGRCHSAAHLEKELDERDEKGKQRRADTRPSSPFGYEGAPLTGLTERLHGVPFSNLDKRQEFLPVVRGVFARAVADTRRPINEVSLWDWSSVVAALYKAALAAAVLGHKPDPDDLRWRLLRVRVDGAAFWGRVGQIPDLLARRQLLAEALDELRTLLEDAIPLATEVYRDEDGALFVVPDVHGLLQLADAQGIPLRQHLLQSFGSAKVAGEMAAAQEARRKSQSAADASKTELAGELVPSLELHTRSWRGSMRTSLAPDDMPPVADLLAAAPQAWADPAWVHDQWKEARGDVCTACGLRPQTRHTGLCSTCARRRRGRAEQWAQNLHTTIWTDEVADANGRLALVVGRFDLAHWLDGTLVGTLLLEEPAGGKAAAKNPSFARLRRIWETTRTFWREVLPAEAGADLGTSAIGQLLGSAGPRLCLLPEGAGGASLEEGHAYDLVLGQVRLSVLPWQGQLLSTDNLSYVAKLLGAPGQVWRSGEEAAQYVARRLRSAGHVAWEDRAGYGASRRGRGELRLAEVGLERTGYRRAIPILAEPRTFMALVPADRALEAVQVIKKKYEREMNKVRNRLPLALGVIYFGRHTPLAAALDAGRRMLAREPDPRETRGWEVAANQAGSAGPEQGHWARWHDVTLQRGQRRARLRISTVMGDGRTEDPWYPYFYVERPAPGKPLSQRTRWCRAACPWALGADGKPEEADLVHVSELVAGDVVYLAPSTFDYEYLDTTARRFDIAYTAGRRRSPERAQRPYLLEEIDELERLWGLLRPISAARTQVYALAALIEAKRRDWGQPRGDGALALPGDAAFRRLCEDALATVKWQQKPWHEIRRDDRDLLLHAALSGMLSDVLELHLTLGQEGDEE